LDLIELKAIRRSGKGNSPARALRREGLVPAVLYGRELEPTLLSIGRKDLEQIVKRGNIGQMLLHIALEGDDSPAKAAMIKELQRHPVKGSFLHVDFYQVTMDRKIRVEVPVVTTGKAKGVAEGGLLQIIRRSVEVLCYPNKIPEAINIDITDLDVGDSVHVSDLPLSSDIEIPAEVNYTVLTILSQKAEGPEFEKAEGEEPAEEPAAAESEG
jgi:large subunit ribosomal protein L25